MNTLQPDIDTHTPQTSFTPYLFLLLFAASLSANVYLGYCLNRTKSGGSRPDGAAVSTENKVGGTVKALSVQTSAGDAQRLQLTGTQDTVVYIFSPNCHWCAINLASIRSLAEQRGSSYRFIGISSNPDKELLNKYLAKSPLPFPTFLDDSSRDFESLDFTGTPQTLLIRKDGRVEHNWSGAYGFNVGANLERVFSVKLPDIGSAYVSKAANSQRTEPGAS
jgi:peroxiredoxin